MLATALLSAQAAFSQHTEYIKYGDFSQWVTRHLHESAVIGGKNTTVYAIGPNATIEGNQPYVAQGGSPWASSNVYAKVAGVVKTSNAVYPYDRGGGDKCAQLCSVMEHLKVLGLVNMDVMVTGSIFLGRMLEPISSTTNPYGKLEMGIPYTKRPNSVVLDYKLEVPNVNTRVKATGFGSKKTIQGLDAASVFVLLQRRWEDSEGNIHAMRVGTGGETFSTNTNWVNGHKIPIHYGNCQKENGYKWEKLLDEKTTFQTRNSKGKMVPIIEEGWDSADATPTHVILMLSSGYYEAFVGTEGLTFYVDNVGFAF